MDTISKYLALPSGEQTRILKVAREVNRASRGVINIRYTFDTLVDVAYAQRENKMHDTAEMRRARFA